MTKTYHDIDAVTRLLEEKERDLELAARIGQSLLKKNKTLSERSQFLEEQVEHIREEVSQLRHDLLMKDELLQFYTNAVEESNGDSVGSTPVRQNDAYHAVPNHLPLDSLQKKLKDLEEENIVLRSEAFNLETETISYEEKEQQLVTDCVKELRDANLQIASVSEELAKKSEDASRQQEEITHLLSQIVDLQKKAKSYAVENEDLTQHLGAAKDAQRALTSELKELEEKHAECAEMLHEAQEELKNFRNKTLPHSTPRRFHSLGLFPLDSLAAEIEGTMRKEIEMSDPEVEQQRLQPRRVFQTVRNVNQTVCQRSVGSSHMNIPGSNQSCVTSRRSSCQSTSRSSVYEADGSEVDNRFNTVMADSQRYKDSNKKPGTPGTPGSRDLQAALRRLALRQDSEQGNVYALVADNSELDKGGDEESGSEDSLVSLGTLHSLYSIYSNRSYLPEKLQIVKPLEGSVTLHAWQQLAQPHLGGILDTRPGVVTKGFRGLELDLDEVHQLADLEEDEPGQHSQPNTSVLGSLLRSPGYSPPCPRNSNSWEDEAREDEGTSGMEARESEASSVQFPGKCVSHSSSTYTFTTCRIQRPLSLLSGSSLSSISRLRAQSSTSTISTWREERGLLPASPPDHACPNHPGNSSLSSLPSTTSECESGGLMLPADYSPWDPPYRTFLVSRPASSLLNAAEDSPSPTETDQLRLVDVLKKYSPPARSRTPGMVVVPRSVVSYPAGGLSCFSSGFR